MLKIAAAVCKQIMAAWVKVRSGWVLDGLEGGAQGLC